MRNAQDMVDELLEQGGMNRRRFFNLLGRGAAAAAVAPQMLAAAPAAVPAAPAAAAVPAGIWTATMSDAIRQIRDRFIDERVKGFTHPDTGAWVPGAPIEQVVGRWERAFPQFVRVLRMTVPGSVFDRRLRLTHGPEEPVPQPFGNQTAEEYARRYRGPEQQQTADDRTARERERIERDQPREQQPIQQPQKQPQRRKTQQVWPPKAERGPEEEEWFGNEQESVYNSRMKAEGVVETLLEADPEAEQKAADLIAKWDKAHTTYQDLYKKKVEAHRLFRELGRSIAYERALARARVDKSQVSHQIYGAQIGSTHNYKKTRPMRQCRSFHCKDRRNYPEEQAECPTCGDPLQTRQVPYSFSDLHGKMANHMIGVELNDGTRVFFDEPIPPIPSVG